MTGCPDARAITSSRDTNTFVFYRNGLMSENHFHDQRTDVDGQCRMGRRYVEAERKSVSPRRLLFGIAVILTVVCVAGGCVQRRLIVKTQPEGAFVSIGREPVGYSPVSIPYTYHGTRDIQIEKDGYKPINVQQRIKPNWYSIFPISFFTENFSPREIRDQRILDFQLEPKTLTNENDLIRRANDLRTNVQRGTIASPVR